MPIIKNPNKLSTLATKEGLLILIFMLTLVSLFILGIVFFTRWDESDKNYLIYVENAKQYIASNDIESQSTTAKSSLERAFSSNQMRAASRGVSKAKFSEEDEDSMFKSETFVDSEVDSAYLNKVDTFVSKILFQGSAGTSVIEKGHMLSHFIKTLYREQMFSAPFAYPSTFKPRVIRWLEIFSELLLEMCILAIFFSIFYPTTANCGQFITKETCESVIVTVTRESQCIYTSDENSYKF